MEHNYETEPNDSPNAPLASVQRQKLNKLSKLEEGGADSPGTGDAHATANHREPLPERLQLTSPMEIPLHKESPGWLDSHQHEDPERDPAV